MNDKKILIIDIETTGFLGQDGKIVEIGIVELDLDNGNIETVFDKVTHEKDITKEEVEKSWIIKNSDLTIEDIRQSTRLDLLQEEIQQIIDQHPAGITAFNKKFDFDFMEDRGFVLKKQLPCPMLLSTNILKLPGKFNKPKWPKVQEAYDFFVGENDYEEQHRGADDAAHEAIIVYALYLKGVFKI